MVQFLSFYLVTSIDLVSNNFEWDGFLPANIATKNSRPKPITTMGQSRTQFNWNDSFALSFSFSNSLKGARHPRISSHAFLHNNGVSVATNSAGGAPL
jgi:hypothetical protein